jgi:hypothetical protein
MSHKAEIIIFSGCGWHHPDIDRSHRSLRWRPSLPYCLKTDWREQIAASIIEDILYDHRALPALKLLLLTHARFKLFRRRENGVDDNCNRQGTFKLKMQDTIDTGSCFCVAVRLYEHDMLANQLYFRGVMPVNTPPPPPTLFPLAGQTASPVVPVSAERPTLPAPTRSTSTRPSRQSASRRRISRVYHHSLTSSVGTMYFTREVSSAARTSRLGSLLPRLLTWAPPGHLTVFLRQ